MTRARITRIGLFRAQFATVLLALRLLCARMAETRVTDAVVTPGGPSKRMPCDSSVASIEDGEQLRSTVQQATVDVSARAYKGRVDEVNVVSGSGAFFTFSILAARPCSSTVGKDAPCASGRGGR